MPKATHRHEKRTRGSNQPSSKSQQHLTPFDCLISQIVLWIYPPCLPWSTTHGPWPREPMPSVPGTRQWKINTKGGQKGTRLARLAVMHWRRPRRRTTSKAEGFIFHRFWHFAATETTSTSTAARNNQAASQPKSRISNRCRGGIQASGGSAGRLIPHWHTTGSGGPTDGPPAGAADSLDSPPDAALLCAYSNQIS